MTSALLQRVPDDEAHPWAQSVNPLYDLLMGSVGGGILLAGHDGTRRDNTLATNYALEASSQATGGLHAAFPLKATAPGVAKTAANSVLLVQDLGLLIGVGKVARFYDAAGTDYAQIGGDADGGLVVGGSGSNAGLLALTTLALGATPATVGAVRVTSNTGQYWRNAANGANLLGVGYDGGDNLLLGDAANGASATLYAKAAGSVYLTTGSTDRVAVTNASVTLTDSLLFNADATYDIGASGATRPRDLFLSRNAAIGGTLTLTGGQVAFPATQAPSGNANTLDDYEEGSWTPSIGGSATYTDQTGSYVKIGRQVTVWGRLAINAIGTGSTGTISGLPFAADITATGAVSAWASLASAVTFIAVNISGSTAILVGATAAAASGAALSVLQSGSSVRFSATYTTAN